MAGPLKGTRVLDLTSFVSEPHVTQMMADFGADVVKVEPPGLGDPTRELDKLAGEPDSLFAITISRGKRSLTLDLYSEAGKAVLAGLIKTADVLVENFRPGTMERMGFGWEQVKELNPRLVFVRVSGFGQDGPWAGRAAYDPVIQALSGFHGTDRRSGRPADCLRHHHHRLPDRSAHGHRHPPPPCNHGSVWARANGWTSPCWMALPPC